MADSGTIEAHALAGKVALVTGASRGVGAEIARLPAERGADVVVNYRSKGRRAEAVAETVRAAGRRALVVQADLVDEAAVAAMFSAVRETFGALDLLVLNASGGLEKEMPADYAMRLNHDAQLGALDQALPLVAAGSRIVFVTSHLAHFHGQKPGMPEYEPVAASKHAGEIALRARVPELAALGISLIVVSGDLIEGTITPKLLERMRPGVIAQRRAEAGTLPTTESFARAIVAAATADLPSGETVYVGSTD